MSLWGAYETDESKPKYLTDEEKKNCYATADGWVYKHPNGKEEILVAIGNLAGTSGTTNLGEATITDVTWVTTTLTADSDPDDTITVKVGYNEKVTVTGNPTITITNDDTSGDGNGDYTLAYSAGTGTNQLTFTGTGLTLSATDELSIGAQNIALNSGTIKDAGVATASGVAISAAQGTAAGAITVTAA
jgi:hypothetical protein